LQTLSTLKHNESVDRTTIPFPGKSAKREKDRPISGKEVGDEVGGSTAARIDLLKG
jgi:hypothetical protein